MNRILATTSITLSIILISCAAGQKNGPSKSIGTVSKGKLINGERFPFKGPNFNYFSWFSYYMLERGYAHEKVVQANMNTYEKLKNDYPDFSWKVMECSRKEGGKMKPHRTHQNGLSIDYMVPLKNTQTGNPYLKKDNLGIWHYLLKFDQNGYLKNKEEKVQIDFNKMAHHIYILNKTAKKHGLKVKKVLFKIDLKDNLFKTEYGKKLKKEGIYFAKYLTSKIDDLHDDHYHIDFEVL